MSPVPEERLASYRRRHRERLHGLQALRSTATRADDAQAWYRDGELLVVDEERRYVERYLAGRGRELTRLGDEQVAPGLRRYLASGLDVPQAIQAVHAELPGGAQVAAPNHVFFSTPFNHGGPFGPPQPADAALLRPRRSDSGLVSIAIIDTGLWKDSQLPEVYFKPGAVDAEVETDVDEDGLLDGDVGHANFIAGVIVRHAHRVELSVIKVLDTFGVCTEDQLVQALDKLDPSVQVINLSLGGYTLDGRPPLPLQAALARALTGPDRVVVAAAGNDGNRAEPFWPAAFTTAGQPWSDRVAAVAAHDGREVCEWSNTGPWVTLAAPGQEVRSTYINHREFPSGWAQWSGTSFATPRVVAEVASQISRGSTALAALQRVVATSPSSYRGYARLM